MKITNQSTLSSKITLPDSSTEAIETKSNILNTENMTTSFLKEKTSTKNFARAGENVEISLKLTNNSDYDITDINILDTISSGASFFSGSVSIDSVSYASYDPTVGFQLSNPLPAGQTTTIKYSIIIDENITTSQVETSSHLTYSVNNTQNLVEDSNTLDIEIINNEIVLTKTSDKSAVISGQSLTYIIEIKNEGNVKNTNLIFSDPIPSGVSFIPESVTIDDLPFKDANPNDGFALPDLEANKSMIIKFNVTVN